MTNTKRCRVILLGALCLSLVQLTFAQTLPETVSALPRLVRFGGTAKETNGDALSGVVGITFALYAEQTGGAALWQETQNVTADSNGHYTALLGASKTEGLPADLFTSEQAHWVGVQVQGQPEQPRVLLVSAPYALKAGDAETIGGLPPSAFVLAAPSAGGSAMASPSAASAARSDAAPATTTDVTTTGGTADYLPLFTGASTILDSVVFQSGTKIGINTSTPTAALDVVGGGAFHGALSLPATGTATATAGTNSEPLDLVASSFNSGTSAAVAQTFQVETVPVGNGSAAPSGALSLLYGSGTNTPAATGLQIASNGVITFASGQTLPAVTGNVSVTGGVTASGTVQGSAVNSTTTLDIGGAPVIQASSALGNFSAGLGAATTGSDNTAVGDSALSANTTGVDNTATGYQALYSNKTGVQNTATGTYALNSNVSGGYNTASGQTALNSTTSGSFNTASGYAALYFNTTGGSNTALGFDAGPPPGYTNLSNSTAIGAYAAVTESNALVLGSIPGMNGATNPVNVGIGTTAPAYTLDVYGNGHFTEPVTFASGQPFPGTIASVSGTSPITAATSNGAVTVGLNTSNLALLNAVTNNFTGNVTASGTVQGGVVNATTGFDIGGSVFASGNFSLANDYVGFFAGSSTGTGEFNTALGQFALSSNSTGNNSTASGFEALQNNSQGGNNTATGYQAMIDNTKGSGNTATGSYSLYYNTTGLYNTAFGYYAGQTFQSSQLTGNNNTAVGAGSMFETGSISNATAIGSNAVVTQSNTLILGCIAGSNGCGGAVNVGIGTNTPTGMLNVVAANPSASSLTAIVAQGLNLNSQNVGNGGDGVDAAGGTGAPGGIGGNGVYGQGGVGMGSGIGGAAGSGGYFVGGDGITDGTPGYGVYGQGGSDGGETGDAGYFNGSVQYTGNLIGPGPEVKMDDPLDPANKYLFHASVESSEMKDIYDGTVTTDSQGNATVQLPEWFEALNTDFRYQLTAIGQFAQAIVSGEVANNQFSIKTDKPNVKISWQITGVRQDAYAKANPLVVEQEKDARERGYYIHPELYGASAQQSVEWARHPQMMRKIQETKAKQMAASQKLAAAGH